jgi:hypothetical protein
MRINVIDVKVNKVPGKAWNQVEVSYKNDNGELKGKKLMSFSVKDGLDLLTKAKEGDLLDVGVVQENGYWNWKTVSPANGAAPAKTGYSVPARDFETKTERAARQVLIVRQSCLSTAVALYGMGKVVPAVGDVIEVAKQLEAFVFSPTETSEDPAAE